MSTDVERRLREVEIQLAGALQKIADSLSSLEKLAQRHDLILFGRPGDSQSRGLPERVALLEQVDSPNLSERVALLEQAGRIKRLVAGIVIPSLITVAGNALFRYFWS